MPVLPGGASREGKKNAWNAFFLKLFPPNLDRKAGVTVSSSHEAPNGSIEVPKSKMTS
jgi:hypothetical protein